MLQEIATPLAGLAMTDISKNKNAHPNRDERNARGTTLIPALALQGLQAPVEYGHLAYTPVQVTLNDSGFPTF